MTHVTTPSTFDSTQTKAVGANGQFGLIILGNTGVGKSFLANILLEREVFAQGSSSSSITHTTEYRETDLLDKSYAIFDIPGLIEVEQQRIDQNKQEIDKAFAQRPNSIVIYVFHPQAGRIKEEDITALYAINAAYSFKPQSLILVMNCLSKNRPLYYEGTTLVLLQQLLRGIQITSRNLCFLEEIDGKANERQFLKEQLLEVNTSI